LSNNSQNKVIRYLAATVTLVFQGAVRWQEAKQIRNSVKNYMQSAVDQIG